MSAFEYRHLVVSRRAQVLPDLNTLGAKGWEVVLREPEDIGSYAYLLKRTKPEDADRAIKVAVPPNLLTSVPATLPVPANTDAVAHERFVATEQNGPWASGGGGKPLVEYEPSSGEWKVDGQTISRWDAEHFQVYGHLPRRNKVPATA